MIPISDTVQRRHFPVMTWTLIALNTAAFIYELRLQQVRPDLVEDFIARFALVPARFTEPLLARRMGLPPGAWPTLFTAMFLHGGLMHLLGNMWTLRLFGDDVEDRMGPLRFLAFYLLCGLVSMAVELKASPDPTVPVLGASGAIAGVMGAFFAMFPHARIRILVPLLFWPLFFEVPALFYLAFWFFTQVSSGTLALAGGDAGGVAWWAHVGGFLAGLALFAIFVHRDRWQRDDPGYLLPHAR